MVSRWYTIGVRAETMRRLDSFKSSPDEPYDSLLNRMMDFIVAWEDVWQLEKETQ